MVLAKKKKSAISRKGDILFYWGVLLLPLIQIAIFYFAVNINSILMAFQTHVGDGVYVFSGFSNFADIFASTNASNLIELRYAIENSLFLYFFGLVAHTPLPILFSYYIYKNKLSGGIMKILLFLPSIIPATTLGSLYYYLGNHVFPAIGLVQLNDQSRWQVIFSLQLLALPFGYGASLIMYSGAMSGIDQSLSEAAQIDGAGPMQEFLHLTLPMIWPTFATFTIVGVAGIFTNQANLFAIFPKGFENPDETGKVTTIGYFLFKRVADLGNNTMPALNGYPQLSAYGVMFTVCAIPLVYAVKGLMSKLGPKTE